MPFTGTVMGRLNMRNLTPANWYRFLVDIPTLETARLRLVPPEERHFEAYAALVGDAAFMQHLEKAALDRAEAYRSLCAMLGHWHLRGWGNFLVEEREAGLLVGRIGINDWVGWPEPELGWWTVPAAWGRGYAPEAARAVLELARTRYARTRLVSFIRPANRASIRVAEKLGAVPERDIDLHGGIARVYVHALQ
jgi:RimJ/RimL family protein N-acetyltransferase